MYKGIHAEVLHLTKFDECSDLSKTYLGKTDMTRETKIKEEKSPISGQGYTVGKLLDNTECHNTVRYRSKQVIMSKSYYLRCKTLHALPKFMSKAQRIQVWNGQCVSVLFIIPVIADTWSQI